MPVIKIKGTDIRLNCEQAENLLTVLLREHIFVENPCSGKGTCGKCRVRLLGEWENKVSETEEKFLKKEEIKEGIRLACLTDVTDDMEIELLTQEKAGKVMTSGYMPDFQKEFRQGFGIAVDIGTTTVVTELVNMKDGMILAQDSMINPQKQFGLDVLTRITYEYDHPDDGVGKLQKAIVDALNHMIENMCTKAGVFPENIAEIDVAANCTMLHMLLGIDARQIGHAPYQPVFKEAQTIKAQKIGIRAGKETILYCLPSVSSYIGADIVAGAYVCGLQKEKENVLFIDIGTNGEIVLASGGKLLSCSCAAGPALEGMNITCGMRAADGAIEEVHIEQGGVKVQVIGGESPEGLCGSGILSVMKELLRTGIVKNTGVFVKKEAIPDSDSRSSLIRLNGTKREFIINHDPEIFVTQGDIRQIQLAKGAILSGFLALLNRAGISMEELSKVLIAGQFGAHLPAESLVGTGILPEFVKDKIIYVGNSSKTGAYMTLMSAKAKREIEILAEDISYMELAETENYERLFTESMIFPGKGREKWKR